MPQFDFANVFWPQLIWLAVIFSVLFFGIVLPTLPKLGRAVDAREEKIKGDIDGAEAAKANADIVVEENETGHAKAQESSRAVVALAKDKAAKSVEKKLAAANEKIEAKLNAAQAELAQARTKAMAEIETIAADSAADIVEKLSGTRPAAAAAKAAAKSVLAEA